MFDVSVERLAELFDVNRDGQLTVEEVAAGLSAHGHAGRALRGRVLGSILRAAPSPGGACRARLNVGVDAVRVMIDRVEGKDGDRDAEGDEELDLGDGVPMSTVGALRPTEEQRKPHRSDVPAQVEVLLTRLRLAELFHGQIQRGVSPVYVVDYNKDDCKAPRLAHLGALHAR